MDFRNKLGQKIGTYKEGIFRKRVKKSKHLFKSGDAWGIDSGVINQLDDMGCKQIRILDEESNTIYSLGFPTWKEKNWELDLGHGEQQFVARKQFKTTKLD